jgi:hypothetical protein
VIGDEGEIDLQILCWCHSAWSVECKDGLVLPSWVPDFSKSLNTTIWFSEYSLFFASGKSSPRLPQVQIDISLSKLSISGARFDTIRVTSSAKNSDGAKYKPGVCMKEMMEIYQSSKNPYRTFEGQQEALWRTPIADLEHIISQNFNGYRRANYRLYNGFRYAGRKPDASSEGTTEGQQLGGRDRVDYERSMGMLSYGRRTFGTSKGYLGLGPDSAQEGDWVCVIAGAAVPFILREESKGMWKLVGECYLHGIMDGEFMDENPQMELELFECF